MDNCPNCNKKTSSSVWNTNKLIADELTVGALNEFLEKSVTNYCDSCITVEKENAVERIGNAIKKTQDSLLETINMVPVISSHSPADWEYTTLGIVTAQVVLGTGFFIEMTSAFSEIFGMQSRTRRRKVKRGEDICFAEIRQQALEMVGNAVLALDIDYTEVGSTKAMVCMAGSAVVLSNNDNNLPADYETQNTELSRLENLLAHIGLAASP